jgi:hypothetical protein
MTKIDPIQTKLKDKSMEAQQSCLSMETHANGTAKSCKCVVPCHLHDFLFLGMICRGLYNFCLLACFNGVYFRHPIFKFGFSRIFLYIFKVFLDALPKIVFSSSNFILIRSY